MATNHSVKRGDAKTIKFDLGRDLTAVTSARVIIAGKAGETPVIDRDGTIDDAAGGIVSLALQVTDYGTGKLEAGVTYIGEVSTEPGPLTHPDDQAAPYFLLTVLPDLG